MSAALKRKSSSLPILFLGDGRIEWISADADKRHTSHSRRVESHSARELATQAVELVGACGERPGRCVVMLGGTLTSQRVMSLGVLAPKDLRVVLQRKAANLLGVEPRDAWYRGVLLAGSEEEAEQRWLLCAVRRSELLALEHELTRAGLRPASIHVSRLALLSASLPGGEGADADLTRIQLSVEPAGVAISLTSKGDLVQQTFVPGRFEQQSGLAASVLQELRSFEGFWRKLSRGGSVDEVLLLGLTEDTSMALTPAIQTALVNRECKVLTGPLCESEQEARAFALSLAAASSDARGDLTPKQPPSSFALAAAGLCALTFGVLGGIWGSERIAEREHAVSQQAISLRLESRDLGRLQRSIAFGKQAHEAAAQRAARLQAVGDAGFALKPLIQDVEQAFGDRAILDSVRLTAGNGEVRLELLGATDPDPVRSLASLSELVDQLERSSSFRDVVLLPPSGNLKADGNDSLRFRVHGRLEEDQ